MNFLRAIIPDRLDLYALRHLGGPLVLALLTLLLVQLLQRLLRLFDLAAATGAPISIVAGMARDLVPHYLGLALPTALMAGIFMAVARMGDDNELDIMLATGRSIGRIALPFFVVALAISVFNMYLFSDLQPMARYRYNAAAYDASNARWNARLESHRFVQAGHGFTLTADLVEPDGRTLHGVFVDRRRVGSEEITTARQGRLVPAPNGHYLELELSDGVIFSEGADASISRIRFEHGSINENFSNAPPPYRERGGALREMTMRELWHDMHDPSQTRPKSELAGEFHGRLARTLLPPLLPLMAVPLGMASKRGRRTPGVVFACLALLVLNQALGFGESLAESGRAAVLPSVWAPLIVFGLVSAWLFLSSLAWPGDNPVMRAMSFIEAVFEGRGRKRPR